MRPSVALFLGLLGAWSLGSSACELPLDPSYYVTTMEEERDFTLEALAKSDLVLVGTVKEISFGPLVPDPSDRTSEVVVSVDQVLVGDMDAPSIALKAHLHAVTVSCVGNEAFWDDQVEHNVQYILFVRAGKILSASLAARSWKKLGLAGQREVVLSATHNAR